MSEPNAIEQARKTLNPTSQDEDALLIAELIHNLGIQRRSARYQQLANGKQPTDPYERVVATQDGGQEILTVEDKDGEARDDDGNKVRTIEQQIVALEAQEKALWEQARIDGVDRGVEEKLPEIQKMSAERILKQINRQPNEEE